MKEIGKKMNYLLILMSHFLNLIKKELELISDTVTMYKSPSEFCQNINQHKDSIVLSTYYGEAAKNSKALIPGMCEANHMLYVGADSYTQMLCNDKYLSKKYIYSEYCTYAGSPNVALSSTAR